MRAVLYGLLWCSIASPCTRLRYGSGVKVPVHQEATAGLSEMWTGAILRARPPHPVEPLAWVDKDLSLGYSAVSGASKVLLPGITRES
jgi:hypothetical protein